MEDKPRRFPRFLAQRGISNEVRATIAKLQPDPHAPTNRQKNVHLPDSRVLAHVANTTIGNIKDARNLFQILPDMGFAREIIISATISPGDLTSSELLYSVRNDDLDSNLTGPMLRIVQEFFDDSYRIRSLLYPILNDVLFETGSYPLLIMPESSIDRIINADNYSGVGMESAINELDSHIRSETNATGQYVPWGILGREGKASNAAVDSYSGVSFESMSHGLNYDQSVKLDGLTISLENLVVEGVPKEGLKELGGALTQVMSNLPGSIEILDNLNILKRPMVVDTKRKIAVQRIYGNRLHSSASLESRSKTDPTAKRTLTQIEKSFYTKRKYQHVPVQPIMTHRQTGTKSYGHPLVLHLSSESVLPVHTPGNPAEHVGYYVLLDIDGNPISVADQSSYYDDIKSQMNNADSYSSQVIQQVRRGFEGMGGIQNEIIDEMGKIHSEALEAELLSRLRAGPLSGNYELGKVESITRMMFSRHLKGQKTNVLFVPAELMSYIAFDYNDFGVGKSILEDGKILGSIRSALMLANTLATINNAVGGKTIEVTLDPEDEDPVSTVEFLLSEYAKVNAQGFSRIVGSTHPLGLADQIQNHGVNVVVSGNTRYPETRMDVSGRDGVNSPIDMDMEEEYRKRHIQMFGLSPEMMEGINQTDFATTVVQNNLMLLKRVIQTQDKLEPFLTSFIRSYTLNSGTLLDELRRFVMDNLGYLPEEVRAQSGKTVGEVADEFVYDFIGALFIELPSPEKDDIGKMMTMYDAYSSAIDTCMDAYISPEMFITDTTIGMEDAIDNVKAVVKAEFQRRFLRKHNIMSEMDVFSTVTEGDGSPAADLLDGASSHLDGLNGSIADYIKSVIEASNRRTKSLHEINKAKEDLETNKETAGGSEGFDDGGDGDDYADGGDGLGEDGDLGMDVDEGGLDDAEEELPEEPEEEEVDESDGDVAEEEEDPQ